MIYLFSFLNGVAWGALDSAASIQKGLRGWRTLYAFVPMMIGCAATATIIYELFGG